jgi:acetyl esterase/lipase
MHPSEPEARIVGMTFRVKLLFTALMTTLATACSGINIYNTITPKDGGVSKVAKSIPFGSDARQKLDIYMPKGKLKAPIIVFVYGGSWATGRRQDYDFVATSLAAKGYMTVVPDYRLVPNVHFPVFIEDGALSVAWVQANAKKYGGNPDQIILVGHSAGAYNVMMLALDTKYLKNAGANLTSIKGVVGLSGPYDFYPWDTPVSVAAFGQAPEPQITQPITFARGDAPPLLLLTGDADKTVKPRNTTALAAKVQNLGGAVTAKYYPGMDHAGIVLNISRPFRHRAPVLVDMTDFIDRITSESVSK